jgi:hypothetical protein
MYQTAECNFFQMDKEYTNFSIPGPSKIYPYWDFWFGNKPSGNPDCQLETLIPSKQTAPRQLIHLSAL